MKDTQMIDPSLKVEEIKGIAKHAFFWGMEPAAGYFVENEINCYAVNGDIYQNGDFVVKDGRLTFYIQTDKPTDPDQLKNWLPVPAGLFHFAARLLDPWFSSLVPRRLTLSTLKGGYSYGRTRRDQTRGFTYS